MFSLPEQLLKTRIFGRRDRELDEHKKLIDTPDYIDEAIVINEARMPTKTLLNDKEETAEPLPTASPNVLSIIGVLPHHLPHIQRFFNNLGLICQFDKETVTGELGNWTVVTLNKDVRSIRELDFQTQFAPNVFGACYVGRYREERVEALKKSINKEEEPNIFREHHDAEDLTSMPLEEKSKMTIFREFIIGEKEIRVKDE